MSTSIKEHERYMRLCLELAEQGRCSVAPNPMVGAVLVREGKIIAQGYHPYFGGAHAEVEAISNVVKDSLAQATLYVNLEPCCHFGKTPPCTDLIIKSGIRKVVIGSSDYSPEVKNQGVQILRAAGIEVVEGVLEHECIELNKRFYIFHALKRPYIFLKWARTDDGFMTRSDHSSKWISSEDSRTLVHRFRSEEASILVGTETARQDNPKLTARLENGRNPLRLVLDRELRLPKSLALFDGSTGTIVFNAKITEVQGNVLYVKVSFGKELLKNILTYLHGIAISSVIVEGGAKLLASFVEANLWDEAAEFVAPQKFSRGLKAPRLDSTLLKSEGKIGSDRYLRYENSSFRDLLKSLEDGRK